MGSPAALRAGEQPAIEEWAAPGPIGISDALLMQRMMGNRATTAVLQRRKGDKKPTPKTPDPEIDGGAEWFDDEQKPDGWDLQARLANLPAGE